MPTVHEYLRWHCFKFEVGREDRVGYCYRVELQDMLARRFRLSCFFPCHTTSRVSGGLVPLRSKLNMIIENVSVMLQEFEYAELGGQETGRCRRDIDVESAA